MAWGSTQEAAALFSVIHLFPNSQLQEVGLCWVDPKRQIPRSWGFQSENLPPLGASPDGLIRHTSVAPAPLPAERYGPALSDLLGMTSAPGNWQSPDQMQAQSSNTAVQQPLHGPESTQTGPDAHWPFNPVSQPAAPQHAQHPSMQSIQMQDPALSEFEALLTKLEISSKNLVSNPLWSGGTSQPAPQTHGVQLSPKLQPSMSPTSASAAPALSASATPFSPTTCSQQSVMATESPAAAPAAPGHTHGDEGADSAARPEEERCQEEWLEAVEIKNVCPFREARDMSSNGKSRRLYRLSDPGPYSRVQSSALHCCCTAQCDYGLWASVPACCRMKSQAEGIYMHAASMAWLSHEMLSATCSCMPMLCTSCMCNSSAAVPDASLDAILNIGLDQSWTRLLAAAASCFDRGCCVQVPCHFVPQLQMEMLASGANSALIVSRSATKVLLLLEYLKTVHHNLIVEQYACICGIWG